MRYYKNFKVSPEKAIYLATLKYRDGSNFLIKTAQTVNTKCLLL